MDIHVRREDLYSARPQVERSRIRQNSEQVERSRIRQNSEPCTFDGRILTNPATTKPLNQTRAKYMRCFLPQDTTGIEVPMIPVVR